MRRNGSLAGGAALLMLGALFLYVERTQDWLALGRYWPMWIIFGGVVSLLKIGDRLVHPVPGALAGNWTGRRMGGRFGRWFRGSRVRREHGWFRGIWMGLGLLAAGVLFLAIQNGVAPEWMLNQDIQNWWPLILIFLGIGQLIGFGVDLTKRVVGGVL